MFTSNTDRSKIASRSLAGRRLVLVDIENVVSGAVTTGAAAMWAKTQVEEVIGCTEQDQVVLGVSHIGLLATGAGWPGKRYVLGSGPDGADRALLEVMEENLAARFTEVVVVSGDGIFAEAVSALAGNGVVVTVVAHPDGLSKRLRMAASVVQNFSGRFELVVTLTGGAA